MPFIIPNTDQATYAAQAEPDRGDFDALVSGIDSIGVLNGCAVTAQTFPNMTVAVASGAVITGATINPVPVAAQNATIPAADATNPRIDLVVVSPDGFLTVRTGTPAVSPEYPLMTPGDVLLASIMVPANISTIDSTRIIDKRVMTSTVNSRVPMIGAKLVVFGHSLTSGGGVQPLTRGWHALLAAAVRGYLWDQGVGGAQLAKAAIASTVNGFGGITQVLQGCSLNPSVPIRWRGNYSGTTVYHDGDGVISGGYAWRNTAGQALSGLAPPAGSATWPGANANGWQQVMRGNVAQGPWTGHPYLGIFMFGNNDLGNVYQKNPQPFLSAMQTALARYQSSEVWEALVNPTAELNSMITYSWANPTKVTGLYGSGLGVVQMRGTANDTLTVTTPPDFPGGFLDLGFALVPQSGVTTLSSGALSFTLDGGSVNVKCSGMADGPTVNFGSPNRHHINGLSLKTQITTTATTSIQTTAIPSGVTAPISGDTLSVGMPGSVDTFNITAVSTSAGTTTWTVTSKTPTFAHPVGDAVWPSATAQGGWSYIANVVIRVPVPAGQHQVVGTVQASPAMAGIYFNYAQLEPLDPPQGIVTALFKPINYATYWPTVPNDNDVVTWNNALQNLVGPGKEFNQIVLDIFANTLKPATSIASNPITAGQTGITFLSVAPTPTAYNSGDHIYLGSGVTQESCVASANVAAGATTIPVTSFTATYAHPVGDTVYDYNLVKDYFYSDDVHPNHNGHQQLLDTVLTALSGMTFTNQQVAGQETLYQQSRQMLGLNANLVVNTTQWKQLALPASTSWPNMHAEPGDIIEIDLAGSWDASATITGFLDIGCYNPDQTEATLATVATTSGSPTMTTTTAWPAGVKGMMVLGPNIPAGTYVMDVASTTSLTLSKNASATASAQTMSFLSVIDFVSSVGVGLGAGLGQSLTLFGVQSTNGISALKSVSASASVFDKASGRFWFPVQERHIIGGYVTFGLYGKVGTAGTRNIVGSAADQSWLKLTNVRNVSYWVSA